MAVNCRVNVIKCKLTALYVFNPAFQLLHHTISIEQRGGFAHLAPRHGALCNRMFVINVTFAPVLPRKPQAFSVDDDIHHATLQQSRRFQTLATISWPGNLGMRHIEPIDRWQLSQSCTVCIGQGLCRCRLDHRVDSLLTTVKSLYLSIISFFSL